ncbi:FG-GAP repeat domain-containing protein [Pyxidicoccus sp. 3LG]
MTQVAKRKWPWGSRLRLSGLALLALAACSEAGLPAETVDASLEGEGAQANGECQVQPPFNPNFEPELEWAWSGSAVMPAHNQVMMTPIVVEVNGDGVPDIVFSTFAGGNYTTNGVLRAISGANGSELWTVTDPALRVRGAASVAGADFDGDGWWSCAPFRSRAVAPSASRTPARSSSGRRRPPTTGAASRSRTWRGMARWRSSMATTSSATRAR